MKKVERFQLRSIKRKSGKECDGKEMEDFHSHGSVTPSKKSSSARPELMDHAQHVVKHDEGWAVQTEKAKRASEVKETKQEAIDRAKEISSKKEQQLSSTEQTGRFRMW